MNFSPTPEELHILLGQSIRRLRRREGMTQEQLAAQVGIDQKQISKIEAGRVHARLYTYLKIANAFNVTLDLFFAEALCLPVTNCATDILDGGKERQFLMDVARAAIRYLEEKET